MTTTIYAVTIHGQNDKGSDLKTYLPIDTPVHVENGESIQFTITLTWNGNSFDFDDPANRYEDKEYGEAVEKWRKVL